MILKINNKAVTFFNNFSLLLKYDSVASVFSFSFYFNPNNPQHKELFKPLQYNIVTLEHNGELLLTGTILSHDFQRGSEKKLSTLSGYSLPGILEDCEIPVELYPLQSDNLSIRQIASKLIQPFGLKMVVDPLVSSLMDQPFETSTADAGQTIKSYLTEICTQKNIIASHDEKGQLVFTTAKIKQQPLLYYQDGQPFTDLKLSVNGQGMHKYITVQSQAQDGNDTDSTGNPAQATVTNPYVSIYRTTTKKQSSGTDNNTLQAAQNKRASEISNIKLIIETDKWELNGKILKPNNIISVLSPENYIYKKTNFFIESIAFIGDSEKTTATITCCLPEVYSHQTPINIFA